MTTPEKRVLTRVDELADEMVEWLRGLVRIPTVNPPGENYKDCAYFVADKLKEFGYEASFIEATGRPECTPERPRVNVIGHLNGSRFHPTLHFNGHIDVVPPGQGSPRRCLQSKRFAALDSSSRDQLNRARPSMKRAAGLRASRIWLSMGMSGRILSIT